MSENSDGIDNKEITIPMHVLEDYIKIAQADEKERILTIIESYNCEHCRDDIMWMIEKR